jgi:hypothetical protein
MQCSDLSSKISGIFLFRLIDTYRSIAQLKLQIRIVRFCFYVGLPADITSPPAPKRVIVLPGASPCGAWSLPRGMGKRDSWCIYKEIVYVSVYVMGNLGNYLPSPAELRKLGTY